MPKFKLQKGMYLVITRALEQESVWIVAWSMDYADVWNYWINHPGYEWDLGMVKTYDVVGTGEVHQIWKINKPIPPQRLAQRVAREAARNA